VFYARRQPQLGEGAGSDQLDGAGIGVPKVMGGVGDQAKGGAGRLVQRLARRGQLDLTVPAAEQLETVKVLQHLDLATDRGLRHAEFFRGLLEAALARGGFEGAQGVQRGKRTAGRAHRGFCASCDGLPLATKIGRFSLNEKSSEPGQTCLSVRAALLIIEPHHSPEECA